MPSSSDRFSQVMLSSKSTAYLTSVNNRPTSVAHSDSVSARNTRLLLVSLSSVGMTISTSVQVPSLSEIISTVHPSTAEGISVAHSSSVLARYTLSSVGTTVSTSVHTDRVPTSSESTLSTVHPFTAKSTSVAHSSSVSARDTLSSVGMTVSTSVHTDRVPTSSESILSTVHPFIADSTSVAHSSNVLAESIRLTPTSLSSIGITVSLSDHTDQDGECYDCILQFNQQCLHKPITYLSTADSTTIAHSSSVFTSAKSIFPTSTSDSTSPLTTTSAVTLTSSETSKDSEATSIVTLPPESSSRNLTTKTTTVPLLSSPTPGESGN